MPAATCCRDCPKSARRAIHPSLQIQRSKVSRMNITIE